MTWKLNTSACYHLHIIFRSLCQLTYFGHLVHWLTHHNDCANGQSRCGNCKKRLKVSTFIYCHLQGNPDQQRFTTQSGVLTGNDRSGTAQVATAHCPNERTLDPAVCSYNRPPMPQPAALWPSPRNVLRQRLTIFSSVCYQILIATHLPTPEGWKAESALLADW